MYVTEKTMRSEMQEMLGLIRSIGNDMENEIQSLLAVLENYQSQLDAQQEVLNKMHSTIQNITREIGIKQNES